MIDTSVWSLALRKRGPADHAQVKRLQELIGQEDLAITGTILQEVLQTYREDDVVADVMRYLAPYRLLAVDRAISSEAARIYRRCVAEGMGASTIDCQIAAAALGHDCKLLTADTDFRRIARVCDLELL